MGERREKESQKDTHDLLERYREYQTQQGFSLSCTFGMQVPLPRTNIHSFRWWWGEAETSYREKGTHSHTTCLIFVTNGISSLLSQTRTSVIFFQFPLSLFLSGWMEDTKVECDKQTIHETHLLSIFSIETNTVDEFAYFTLVEFFLVWQSTLSLWYLVGCSICLGYFPISIKMHDLSACPSLCSIGKGLFVPFRVAPLLPSFCAIIHTGAEMEHKEREWSREQRRKIRTPSFKERRQREGGFPFQRLPV